MVVKFSDVCMCILLALVFFGLLQHCFAALHLFNVAAMFLLSDLSKHMQKLYNPLLNIKFTYFNVVYS